MAKKQPAQPKQKSPIEILKELLATVDAKRQAEVDEAQSQEKLDQGAASGGEVMPDYKGHDVYLSFDGDGIGNAVARAEETDDEEALSDVSQRINAGQEVFKDFIISNGGRMIEAGGDEGLGFVNSKALDMIEEFRQDYLETVGATVTVGVGQKISECTKARMLGKLRGKDQVCHWTEQTETEIELRQQEGGEEAKKLTEGGLIGDQKSGMSQKEPTSSNKASPDMASPDIEATHDDDEAPQEEMSPDAVPDISGGAEENTPFVSEKPSKIKNDSGDYSDMDMGSRDRMHHHNAAKKTAREHGGDPKFLESVSRRLLR